MCEIRSMEAERFLLGRSTGMTFGTRVHVHFLGQTKVKASIARNIPPNILLCLEEHTCNASLKQPKKSRNLE
jgi:hypothetical protein